MATGALSGLADVGKLDELRRRIFFLIGAIIIYRLGTFIPIPGIDVDVMAQLYEQNSQGILGMLNMFSGGALERMSLFALGVMPYISASIIVQLLSHTMPYLQQLRKEGDAGRRKITMYTRWGTLVLASFQGVGIAIALQGQSHGGLPLAVVQGPAFVFMSALALVTGSMFLMWLGEQITERGVGNGISIIILAGIVAGLPSAIGSTFELARTGELNYFSLIFLFVMALLVTAFVVFMERGQRRITVNYAQRMHGANQAGGASHLPLKVNMAGVIPPIFASSIILFPATFSGFSDAGWAKNLATTLAPGQPLYIFLYGAAIMFFCFFYTALVFNSRETADNLKKSGAFIPGIRPGEQTAGYIDSVMSRLTLIGAIYVTAVCLLPEFLILYWNVPFYFGGTSLLIIVVVVLDLMAQIQAHLVSHQYDSLMKKANKRGGATSLLR